MKRLAPAVSVFFLLLSSFSLALATPAHIPQTGQTTCYGATGAVIDCAGTGQDGDTRMGIVSPTPRFTDNSIAAPSDETVTDNLTGLIWAKNGNLAAVRKTWQESLDYIKDLNSSNYLGHNDWRLPNRIELESMFNVGYANPVNWLNTSGFYNVQASIYWSSSSYEGDTNSAWTVYWDGGYVFAPKSRYNYVWPVRAGQSESSGSLALAKTGQTTCSDQSGAVINCIGTGQDGELQTGAAWPVPRFSDNGNQTMTDNLTGLIWTQNGNPAAETKNWQNALDYITTLNSSNYQGHNDWRLPNRNELDSLVNKGEADSAAWLNTQGFFNVNTYNYWSSSSYAYKPDFAWYVFMYDGGAYSNGKANTYFVWPVRGGYSGTVVHLNVSKEGAGTGTVNPDSGSIAWNGNTGTGDYLQNSIVILTATADPGLVFAGWSGACSGTAPCTVTMDTAKSVSATFVPLNTLLPATWSFGEVATFSTLAEKAFTITNNGLTPLAVTGVSVTGSNPTQFSVTPGSCPSLTPTLDPGASCALTVGFSPTTQGGKSATLNVATDSIVTQVLSAQLSGIGVIPYYTLTTTIGGIGSGRVYFNSGGFCSGSCSQSFTLNRQLQLTPAPDPGSQFLGWAGCDSVTGETCFVTMSNAKSVTATFTLAPSKVEWWVAKGPAGTSISSLVVDSLSPETVFAGGTNGSALYRSSDNGSTWNTNTTGLTDFHLYSLAVNPQNPATVFTSTGTAGLFRSDDSGANWSLVNNELVVASVLAINPANPAIMFGKGCGSICRSSDSGTSWAPSGFGIITIHHVTDIRALAIDPATPSTLYACAMGGEGLNGGMFKSVNGGDTWERYETGLTSTLFTSLAIDPLTPASLYAGTSDGGVFKTIDGGATWSAASTGLTNLSVKALAVNPAIPSIIYAATPAGVFRTTDSGANWNLVSNGLGSADVISLAIDPTTPSVVYAGTSGSGVYRLSLIDAIPAIAVTPASQDFGAVATSSSSATVPFTISNSGTGDLYVTAVSLGGANPGSFTLLPGSCTTLTPIIPAGGSCSLEVTFVPTTIGAQSSTLQVASNDPANPLKNIGLTGFAYDPPPVGTITVNSGAGLTSSTAVNLTLAAFDNSGSVAEMRFSNNNSSWSNWELYGTTKAWTLTTLGGDGTKTVFVQFRDAAGNGSGSFADSITLDTTPPVSTITSMPAPYYPASEGSFTFSASESATFQCRMDTGDWAGCSSPYSFSGLVDGNHTFSVKATDLAGNLETAEKSYTFSTDTAAPDTVITGQPPLLSNSASGTFTFTADGAVTYQCKVDAGSWGHCNLVYNFSGLADGSHTFSVRGIDRSGNMDLTPATYTWIIDTTPPESILTASVSGNSATFTVSSNDPTAILQCALDTAAWAVCSGTVSFTGLSSGSHSFSVRAIDPAGNVDPTPAIHSWTYSCNVRVAGGSCYASIGEALAAAPDGGAIQAKAMSFQEGVNFSHAKSLTFSGGFGPNFEPPAPGAMTTVNGLIMTSGSMTVENLMVQ